MWNVKKAVKKVLGIASPDLIDTLWNVNAARGRSFQPECCDLIETLWNVNMRNLKADMEAGKRFNRNIVECKYNKTMFSK